MDTRFKKIIDGNTVVKFRKHIVLNTTDTITDATTGELITVNKQTFNPTDEMLIADGWELYVIPALTDEQILTNAK